MRDGSASAMHGSVTVWVASFLIAVVAVLAVLLWRPTVAVHYVTARAERGDILTEVTASGTVNALVSTEVSSQLSGQVAELVADFNDPVRRGQTLARLDPQSYEASVREAEAELEMAQAELLTREAAAERAAAELANARALRTAEEGETGSTRAQHTEAQLELKRRQALSDRAMISASEVEQARSRFDSTGALLQAAEAQLKVRDAAILAAEAELRMAQAEVAHARAEVKHKAAALERAQVDLKRTEIRSPLDGVVIRRNVELGQTVAASLQAPTLFTIAHDLRAMKVEVKVDEADIGQIREGQPVTFTVDTYPDRRFAGTVEQIRKAHEIFQNVVTYTVIVSADNDDLALFPGMTAVVHIVVDQARDVLRVPNAALRYSPKAALDARETSHAPSPATVWRLDGAGVPTPLAVTLGASDSRHTAVTADALTAGDEVLTAEIQERHEGIHGRGAAIGHALQQAVHEAWGWLTTRAGSPSAAR